MAAGAGDLWSMWGAHDGAIPHSYHGTPVPDYWCGRSRINVGEPDVCQTIHGGSLEDAIGEIEIGHFFVDQIERPARGQSALPVVLQRGKVMAAVYRWGPYRPGTGTPEGYALRLLVQPSHQVIPNPVGSQVGSNGVRPSQ